MANKGDLLLKFKYFVIIKKKIVLLFFNSSSSITYILLNNRNMAYFWHNVFNKLKLLFCRVAVNTFKVMRVYDMIVLLK